MILIDSIVKSKVGNPLGYFNYSDIMTKYVVNLQARHLIALLILLAGSLSSFGYVKTDTLISSLGDKVYITYEAVHVGDGKFKIRFNSVRAFPSGINSSKYKNKKNHKIFIFDSYAQNDYKFTGHEITRILSPKGLNYKLSPGGYIELNNGVAIEMEANDGKEHTIEIPIYLANYKKSVIPKQKSTCEIFADCGNLSVKLAIPTTKVSHTKPAETITIPSTEGQTEYPPMEYGEYNQPMPYYDMPYNPESGGAVGVPTADEIERIIAMINRPDISSSELQDCQIQLQGYLNNTSDTSLRNQINNAISTCSAKKVAAQQKEQKAQEDKIKAENDSIQKAQQTEKSKSEKRTLWMIIGGVILAILGFVGSQLTQHFRNLRNLRSVEQMQENLERRATNEARRRASSAIRQKVGQAEGAIRNKGRDAVRGAVNHTTGKSKPITIGEGAEKANGKTTASVKKSSANISSVRKPVGTTSASSVRKTAGTTSPASAKKSSGAASAAARAKTASTGTTVPKTGSIFSRFSRKKTGKNDQISI